NERFFFTGENIDDAVDGSGGRCRVQGGEHQMPRFGGGQCQPDGFRVAQFADQNRVRSFSQSSPQGGIEIGGVTRDFTLVDQAPAGRMNEFDGVFQGQDVPLLGFALVSNQGRQRGGFAATGRAGHKDQSVVRTGSGLANGWRAQI